jgi:hypothetical protein
MNGAVCTEEVFIELARKHDITLWKDQATDAFTGIGPAGVFTHLIKKPEGWVYKGTTFERTQQENIEYVNSLGGMSGFITNEFSLTELVRNHLYNQFEERKNG